MKQRTLVERLMIADTIRPGTPPRASDGKIDTFELSESILQNLHAILNSRSGCCESRIDLGMPDFNDLVGRFPDAIAIIANAVRSQIENFEPRLSGVTVRHVPDRSNPLRLAFRINASLMIDEEVTRLSFETVLNNNGFVRVVG